MPDWTKYYGFEMPDRESLTAAILRLPQMREELQAHPCYALHARPHAVADLKGNAQFAQCFAVVDRVLFEPINTWTRHELQYWAHVARKGLATRASAEWGGYPDASFGREFREVLVVAGQAVYQQEVERHEAAQALKNKHRRPEEAEVRTAAPQVRPRVPQLMATGLFFTQFEKATGQSGRTQPAHILQQLQTGEGKTMIFALTTAMYALHGVRLDYITASNPLVDQAAADFDLFYEMLNIKADKNTHDMPNRNKQAHDSADILFGTALSGEKAYL